MGECANLIPFIVCFAGIFVVWLSLQLSPLFRWGFCALVGCQERGAFFIVPRAVFFSDGFNVSSSKVLVLTRCRSWIRSD